MAVVDERQRDSAKRLQAERQRAGRPGPTVADKLAPLLRAFFASGLPVPFEFWDGSSAGPAGGPGRVVVRSPLALRRVLWAPTELGLARAVVSGEVVLEGDLSRVLRVLRDAAAVRSSGPRRRPPPRALLAGLAAAAGVGALGPPPALPPEEARLSGWRHSKRRDAAAIKHHYDVGDDFYRLMLGPAMTYSCARFEAPGATLEEAQRSKHELVCRKLGLVEGARVLDVGCGWGSMVLHAARTYAVRAVGITLSPSQAAWARARAEREGLGAQVEIRLQDYRDLRDETFDAISSIGMFEHVGSERMDQYFTALFSLLGPRGRLLNHAISKPGGSKMRGARFIARYIFPDGELIDVGEVVKGMQRAGFEVRDVESLREHYVLTLRAWLANLEAGWDRAVGLVGERRARAWRLYMSASANAFEEGKIAVHQVLGVRPGPRGESGMPRTRSSW
jgi:cyclopropane-fatty-acyl-phospholipid synthase